MIPTIALEEGISKFIIINLVNSPEKFALSSTFHFIYNRIITIQPFLKAPVRSLDLLQKNQVETQIL